jgi:hypothetical protein
MESGKPASSSVILQSWRVGRRLPVPFHIETITIDPDTPGFARHRLSVTDSQTTIWSSKFA